jgi:hypothetical protein
VTTAVPSRTQKTAAIAVAYLSTHRKLFGRIGAIVSVGTAAIVGIATLRVSPDRPAVTSVPTQTEITPAAKTETAAASKATRTDAKIPTESLNGPFGFSTGPAEQRVPTPPSITARESAATPEPKSIPSPAQVSAIEAPQPSPKPTELQKEFVDIAVELAIRNGRVVEAHVQNLQPGAEAFEATALQIARQRRYAPGTSHTTTVVLRVANGPGRKEP